MTVVSPGSAHDNAAAARRARRQLLRRLRSHVALLAVAVFIAACAGLFIQLASGRDPGLNDASVPVVTQSLDPDAASGADATFAEDDGRTDPSAQSGAPTPGGASGGGFAGGDAGVVTTRQS